MIDDANVYTLDMLGKRLGGLPVSTLKHRIQQLGIPAVARGSRNKLLFDAHAAGLLEAADRLIREGHGMQSIRRRLDLADPVEVAEVEEDDAPAAPAPATALALDRLALALESALAQLEAKDHQLDLLHEELRRSVEAAATFQQKAFYLQGELQRIQGELRESLTPRTPDEKGGWSRLWKKDGPG